jgi:CRP-like cAMP-binding protein
MYVLRSGLIGVYINPEAGPEEVCSEPGVKIAEFDSIGSIIGEAGLFLRRRTATLIALVGETSVESVPFEGGGIDQLVQRNPTIGITLCRSLASRLKSLSEKVGAASSATLGMQTTYCSMAMKYVALVDRLCMREDLRNDAECLAMHPLYRKGQEVLRHQNETHEVFQSAMARNRAGSISIERGSELCHEGDVGRALYLVQEGELEVIVGGRPVAVIEAGELVGEVAVLLKEVPKRTATLRALTPCRLACIPAAEFSSVAEQRPSLLVTIARILSGRINRTNRIASNIKQVLWEELSLLAKSPKSCEAAFQEIVNLFPREAEVAAEARANLKRSYQTYQEMQAVCKTITID